MVGHDDHPWRSGRLTAGLHLPSGKPPPTPRASLEEVLQRLRHLMPYTVPVRRRGVVDIPAQRTGSGDAPLPFRMLRRVPADELSAARRAARHRLAPPRGDYS